MPEFTPTGILHKFVRTGELPVSMLPLESFGSSPEDQAIPSFEDVFGSSPEDPTKPLRSSFESVLLARSGLKALQYLDRFWERQMKGPQISDRMMPVAKIDNITDLQKRNDTLDHKVEYVLDIFRTSMRRALVHELDPRHRVRLPTKVANAYHLLTQADGTDKTIDGIMEAGLSLRDQIKDLFHSANDFYYDYLGYKASIRQIVDLVGNSYDTSTHLETGFHNQAAVEAGTYYGIASIGGLDRIIYLDPSLPHKIEKQMHAAGIIKDQLTHCPFAMRSQFTNPFQNSGDEITESNPLKLVFESLVNKYIGS